jgi:osmotically-inducible protein OsmY
MAQEPMLGLDTADTDLDIHEAVVEAVEGLNGVRESRAPITITVADGVVTLTGIVLSSTMRRAVRYRAATTPGVVKVIDQLEEDPSIRQRVAMALSDDPATAPYQPPITVTSYLAMVTLSGPTMPEAVAARAREIAAGVSGVREVFVRFGN